MILLMIQAQVLVGNLYRGHLGVNRGYRQVFANDSRLKKAKDMGLVSSRLLCQEAATDMQHDLLGSTYDFM